MIWQRPGHASSESHWIEKGRCLSIRSHSGEHNGGGKLHTGPCSHTAARPMPLRATLREDNVLELPKDAPRLVRTNTPLYVVDLGGGTFVVTETEPQIPQIASEFRNALEESGVTAEHLLENLYEVKRDLANEEGRA